MDIATVRKANPTFVRLHELLEKNLFHFLGFCSEVRELTNLVSDIESFSDNADAGKDFIVRMYKFVENFDKACTREIRKMGHQIP